MFARGLDLNPIHNKRNKHSTTYLSTKSYGSSECDQCAIFLVSTLFFKMHPSIEKVSNQNHALNAWYALALQGHNTGLCLKAH